MRWILRALLWLGIGGGLLASACITPRLQQVIWDAVTALTIPACRTVTSCSDFPNDAAWISALLAGSAILGAVAWVVYAGIHEVAKRIMRLVDERPERARG